jgi:uncharacterized protein (UPF0264 family)
MSEAAEAVWTRGLLVSVRTAAEARAAVAGGAAIIDIKEPKAGPLGRATVSVTVGIIEAVAGARPITLACGELVDGIEQISAHTHDVWSRLGANQAVPVAVKAGPRGLRGRPWSEAFARFKNGLPAGVEAVAVAYADWSKSGNDPPLRMLFRAHEAGARTVLIDTFDKAAAGLVSIASADDLRLWIDQARSLSLRLALAGRLTATEVDLVFRLGGDVAGVRSAACLGGRSGQVDASLVAGLVRGASHSGGMGTRCG